MKTTQDFYQTKSSILFLDALCTMQRYNKLLKVKKIGLEMFELSIKQYAELKGITEEFKAENQAEWFQQMNSIKARVINIVNAELIYIRNSGASAPLFAYSKRPAENGIRYS